MFVGTEPARRISMRAPGRRDLWRRAVEKVADGWPEPVRRPGSGDPGRVLPVGLYVALRTDDFGVVVRVEGPFEDVEAARVHILERFGGQGYTAPFDLRRLSYGLF